MRLAPLLSALFVVSCTPSRAIRPLPAGATAITVDLGGPLNQDLGTTIPLPLTAVGVVHGLGGRTNLHGSLHPTGLLALGVGGISLGAAHQLWDQQGASPRLMADLTLIGFLGDAAAGSPAAAARVFVDGSAVLSWDLGAHAVYTGTHIFVQPGSRPLAHAAPFGGVLFHLGRTELTAEAGWLAPYVHNDTLAANWYGIGGRGALQLQLGASFRLGRR